MKPLRCYLLATASSAVLIGSAAAADMPLKARPADPVMSWAGPYAGVNAGAVWNHSSFTDVDYFFFLLPTGPGNNFLSNTHVGATAGGLLGYNWQSGNLVYGIEGDANWVDDKSTTTVFGPVTASSDLKWISTLRGRVGFTYDPMTLVYATGGVAVARYSDTWGQPGFEFPNDSTRVGWTAGGGIERMFAPHWIGRVEALYSDFGTKTGTQFGAGQTYRTDFKHSVTQVRGALSYKW